MREKLPKMTFIYKKNRSHDLVPRPFVRITVFTIKDATRKTRNMYIVYGSVYFFISPAVRVEGIPLS